MPQAPLSPEELKLRQEKHEKIRRNLRILAVCVAAYYFISAGMNWYEDYQADKTALVEDIRAFDGKDALMQILKHSVPSGSLTPEIEVQGNLIKVTGPELLKGISAEIDPTSKEQELAVIVFETQIGTAAPDEEQIKAARAYFSVCENNYSGEILDPLCTAAGFDKNNTKGEYKEGVYGSRKVQYSLTLSGSEHNQLKLKALKSAN